MSDNYLVYFKAWSSESEYYNKAGAFNMRVSEYTQIDQATFDGKSNHRVREYVESYKVKKGPHKNKKIKVKHKGRYHVTSDKKNGRPKNNGIWRIVIKGDNGLNTQQATDIYENTRWLLKLSWKQEFWETSPVPVQTWWKNVYPQFSGMVSSTGEPPAIDGPEITNVDVQWQTHDGSALAPNASETLASTVTDNFSQLNASGQDPVRAFEWSNMDGDIIGASDTFSVLGSEWSTGDVITLTVKLRTNDTDEVVSATTFTLPTITVPEPVVAVIQTGEPASSQEPVVVVDGGTATVDVQAEEPGTFGNDITLEFDGSKSVDTVVTETDHVTVNSGGSVVPAADQIIELSGGTEELLELPDTMFGALAQMDDYILLRYGATNRVELPIMGWYELNDVAPIEVDWDYMDTHGGGDGDKQQVTLTSVATGSDSDPSSFTTPADDPSAVIINNRVDILHGVPDEWAQHEEWDAKTGWWKRDSTRFNDIQYTLGRQTKVYLSGPHQTGLRGAVKTWTGAPKPRVVLIKNARYITDYGIRKSGDNGLSQSNDQLNYIKIKGCANCDSWSYAFWQDAANMNTKPALQFDATEWSLNRIGEQGVSNMFTNSRLETFDLSHRLVLNAENISNWLHYCTRLHTCKLPSVISCNDNNMNANGMFTRCESLTSFDLRCFSDLAARGGLNMENMFYRCTGLTEVNMSNMTFAAANLQQMFYQCSNLANITGWDTIHVHVLRLHQISRVFEGCTSLNDSAVPNFNNWHIVENGYRFLDPDNPPSGWDFGLLTQENFDSQFGSIGSNAGFSAEITMDNIKPAAQIPTPSRWSNPDWSDAMQIEVDLSLSPNRTHVDTWAPGTDIDSIDFDTHPWNNKRIEFWCGYGLGYNRNSYDVLIDWGDGNIEWHSAFKQNNDSRYVNQTNYQTNQRTYFNTGHTYVTHDYATRGKYTIKVLGCSSEFKIGGTHQNPFNSSGWNSWSYTNAMWCVTDITSFGKFNTSKLQVDAIWLRSLPTRWSPGINYVRVDKPDIIRLQPDKLYENDTTWNTSYSLFGWNPMNTWYPDGNGNFLQYTGVAHFPDAGDSPRALNQLHNYRKSNYYMPAGGNATRKIWYYPEPTTPGYFETIQDPITTFGQQKRGPSEMGGVPVTRTYLQTDDGWDSVNQRWTGGDFDQVGGVGRQMAEWPDEYFQGDEYGNVYDYNIPIPYPASIN